MPMSRSKRVVFVALPAKEDEAPQPASLIPGVALTSSPFWPSSTLGGNRGREQGGFLLVGLLAGV